MSCENKEQKLQKIEKLIPSNQIIEKINEQNQFVNKIGNMKIVNGINDSVLKGVSTCNIANNFSSALVDFSNQMSAFAIKQVSPAIDLLNNGIMRQIAETQRKLAEFTFNAYNSLNFALQPLVDSLNEARNNPDSIWNWMKYYDKLSEFFWILPYNMTTEELYEVLNSITTEKEFDKYINKYFSISKVNNLVRDITEMLKNDSERKMLSQIVLAYKNKSYALASVGLTTMIDNLLSYYLINKGCNSRVSIFEPIIDELDERHDCSDFLMVLMMISSNINLLYEDVKFNEKISISTNKKSRRHPMAHGKAYSNKKIDTIMLMNTLYYLLLARNELKMYKDSLYYNSKDKKFYMADKNKKKEIKEALKKQLLN